MRVLVIKKEMMRDILIKILWMLMLIISIAFFSRNVLTVFSTPVKNMVVVIDAGHGGNDPGAVVSGISEEKINLDIALKLRRLIEQSGGIAITIREDDRGLYTEGRNNNKKREDLKNRHDIINNSGADVFVSIHLNSFPIPKYYGAQTFYQKGDEKGRVLAETIQKELLNVLDRGNNRVAKTIDDVYIMKNNKIPGALVECGFLSNEIELQLLQQDHYQEKIAWCIFAAIVKYFEGEGNGVEAIAQ